MSKKTKVKSTPLMDNQSVKELLAIMEANKLPTMKDMLDVLKQVTTMEQQLNAAVTELHTMRRELANAQTRQHPVKNSLRSAVTALEKNTNDMRKQVNELKQNVVDGCKNAVAAFKEKGISALDNIARFFKVKPILETMRDNVNKIIKEDNKAIATIESVSSEYHQAGRHLKNMARAIMGKEAIQEATPVGKLAKAMEAPFRANRACSSTINKGIEAAIGKISRLEEKAHKPSIRQTMQELKQSAQATRDATAAKRPQPAHESR